MLVPLSLVLVFLAVGVFLLMTRSGQFDDMEGPAHRILMDDDSVHTEPPKADEPMVRRGSV